MDEEKGTVKQTKDSIKKLSAMLSGDRARSVFIVIGIAAVVLIFLSSQLSCSDPKTGREISTDEYSSALTDMLRDMVESTEGAGRAKIMLTLDSSYEYVYLEDDKTLQKVNEPVVRGVVIACEGAGDALVCERLTTLVTTALGVPSSKVCITKIT